MLSDDEVQSICLTIQRDYTACDVSDALLKLNIPAAGAVTDISPIPKNDVSKTRIVAPVSTVLYIPKVPADRFPGPENIPTESNIPRNKHWTECPSAGSVVLIQQPQGQRCALIGDLIAARLKLRGSLGVVAAGRIRDIPSCTTLCEGGGFQIWSCGFSAAAPSLETIPWMVDVPLQLGKVCVRPGDIICIDEGEMAIVVVPRDQLTHAFALLPKLKKASDGVLVDIQNGLPLFEATKRHPDFYSNHK